jgi:hypothetical protein
MRAKGPGQADVNGNGKQEVIFTTYTENDQTEHRGRLEIVVTTLSSGVCVYEIN